MEWIEVPVERGNMLATLIDEPCEDKLSHSLPFEKCSDRMAPFASTNLLLKQAEQVETESLESTSRTTHTKLTSVVSSLHTLYESMYDEQEKQCWWRKTFREQKHEIKDKKKVELAQIEFVRQN